MLGIICKSSKREFEVALEEGGDVVVATALGNLLKGDNSIVVGDRVELTSDDKNEFVIKDVLERKNEIFRYLVRQNKKKVTASNVDVLVIVTSLSLPAYKRGIIDRFIVRSVQWNVATIVVFNKYDQFNHEENEDLDLDFERKRLSHIGVNSFVVSAKEKGPDWEALKSSLKDQTAIFLGQSGVGKSSLISSLSGVDLKTKKIGKVGKGSHTTTWSELIDAQHFKFIDSPGIRSFALDDIEADSLQLYFPDIDSLAVECRFRDCNHSEKASGCHLRKKIGDKSNLEAQILESRLESFIRIRQEVLEKSSW